ncbi:uncharacterized protein FIBRA_09426 [Fibroporia radiculosa]|uniref:Transaldolase n=1 Tax=Fibroporia radiculosa TaxID=599839 RepID=J7S6G5_9APHY|nr:uncharacterized protein FIBRA_09426 [Fibroporia radiculosa]CCM07099.1 predicted protein [Fibroporia radiculosa]
MSESKTVLDLLSYVRTRVTVDVDSMDPAVAARHTSGSKFCDMTSNQAIVYSEAAKPERAQLFKTACQLARVSGSDTESQITEALDILTVLLAKEVYPYLTGRVHAQTSPPTAYDTEKTIAHARKLVELFEANGIPRAYNAATGLESTGIRTLATCLFSLPQAVAASQAGCLYVAPYFNELRVHFEPKIWKEYNDTAREHPMAPVIASIVQEFRAIDSKTLVMPASIVTSTEVIALASLQPDHLTLAGAVLDQLAAASNVKLLDEPNTHASLSINTTSNGASYGKDFLADGASALRQALAADAEATRKLADALKIFGEMEQKTRELVRKELGEM